MVISNLQRCNFKPIFQNSILKLNLISTFLKLNFNEHRTTVFRLLRLKSSKRSASTTRKGRERRVDCAQMASSIRALVAEARWRGVWGTVRALKMNKMGTMRYFGGC